MAVKNPEIDTAYKNAYSLMNSADKGFGAIFDMDKEYGKVVAFLKKDRELYDVYEFWIKIGVDKNYNCGKLIGKIYGLNNIDEIADTIRQLCNDTAIISTNTGKIEMTEAIKQQQA